MAGILPTISNLFRPVQQQQQPQAQSPQLQQAQPPQPLGPSDNRLMQQNNPGGVPPTSAPNAPLDAFGTLWQTDPTVSPPTDPWSQPLLPSDPAKINEAASKMNMLQGVNPDLMQKAMSGSDPQAFMDVINHVAQNTLAMSAQLSSATVERAGTGIRDRINSGLEDRFNEFQLKNIPVENAALNHPAAQPLLKIAMQQIRMTNRDLTPQQIHAKAVDYLTQFAGAVNPQQQQQSTGQRSGQQETDWDAFMNS